MSDDEYYSDNNSDKSDSDIEEVSNKKPLFNIAIKKLNVASKSYDDSEPDDADSDEDENNDDNDDNDDNNHDNDDDHDNNHDHDFRSASFNLII